MKHTANQWEILIYQFIQVHLIFIWIVGVCHNFFVLCVLPYDAFSFDFIGINESFCCDRDTRFTLPVYHPFILQCRLSERGGLLKTRCNIKFVENSAYSSLVYLSHYLWKLKFRIPIVVIYILNTAPRAYLDLYSSTLYNIMGIINNGENNITIMGDMNIDLLKCILHSNKMSILIIFFFIGFLYVITKPTWVCSTAATHR